MNAWILTCSPAWPITKVVYTGTIGNSTSPILTTGASPRYSVGQTFVLSFEINQSFNPSATACFNTNNYSYVNNSTCNQSLLSDLTITSQDPNAPFNSNALGIQIFIPNSPTSQPENIGFSRTSTSIFNETTLTVTSNSRTLNLVRWNVPVTYSFTQEGTPYMVYPYSPDGLLSPTALISWYYNNSYYRNYAISNNVNSTIALDFVDWADPFTPTYSLYFSPTQMDIISEAPAPLPFFGAASAFAYSRRLRRRCRVAAESGL